MFDVGNSLSSDTDNLKNQFLILDEGDSFVINGSFGAPEKRYINFSKAKTKFCLSLHYDSDNSCLLVNEKEISTFKTSNRNNSFTSQFCLGSISIKFDYSGTKEVFLKGIVYNFSVHYVVIYKSSILKIHKYLMIKNIKMFRIIKKRFIVF